MSNVADLYNLWLKARHLPPEGAVVVISAVTPQEIHPRPNQAETRLILSFQGKQRRMIVNEGNANRLADLLGDQYTAWPGQKIRLTPKKWGNKDTIVVEAA